MFVDLNNEDQFIDTTNDNIVIVDVITSVRAGASLDVTGYPLTVLYAGHVIIKETATGKYKPLPLTTDKKAYADLPAGHTYEHILIASLLTKKAFAALLISGTVNHLAAPFDMTAILADVKKAMPLITFRAD